MIITLQRSTLYAKSDLISLYLVLGSRTNDDDLRTALCPHFAHASQLLTRRKGTDVNLVVRLIVIHTVIVGY